MSEFECSNGHLSKAGLVCSACGARIVKMDGLTASQLRRQEQSEDREIEEERNEDEDDE